MRGTAKTQLWAQVAVEAFVLRSYIILNDYFSQIQIFFMVVLLDQAIHIRRRMLTDICYDHINVGWRDKVP